jgi:hypothetical protein
MWEKVTDFLKHPIVQLVGGPAILAVIAWIVTHLAKLALWQIWLTIIISICGGLFIVNQIAIWRERTKKKISKLSDEELREIIRRWIDKPFLKVQTNEKDGVLFSFTIENPYKRKVEIVRYKKNPFVIYLGVRIVISDEHLSIMSELPEPKRSDAISGLIMELARIGIAWSGVKYPLKEFEIEDSIPIDDGLTEFYLLQHILFMDRVIIIAVEYIKMITRQFSASAPS